MKSTSTRLPFAHLPATRQTSVLSANRVFLRSCRNACLALAIVSIAWTEAAAQTEPVCTEVKLFNVVAGKGTLNIAAWGSAESYFKKPLWVTLAKPTGEVVTVTMCGVPGAELAITVYQDLNENGKMDSNPMGIPTEPYGASGKPSMFGPPTWDSTKLQVAPGKSIEIRL